MSAEKIDLECDNGGECDLCGNCHCPACDKPCRNRRGTDDDDDDDDDDRSMFADPGGRSALRAASEDNPRNLPCPSCGAPDRLTADDRALGYQCDACADAAEGYGP